MTEGAIGDTKIFVPTGSYLFCRVCPGDVVGWKYSKQIYNPKWYFSTKISQICPAKYQLLQNKTITKCYYTKLFMLQVLLTKKFMFKYKQRHLSDNQETADLSSDRYISFVFNLFRRRVACY